LQHKITGYFTGGEELTGSSLLFYVLKIKILMQSIEKKGEK